MRAARKPLSLTVATADEIYQLRASAIRGAKADLLFRLALLVPATIIVALLALMAQHDLLDFVPALRVALVVLAIAFGLVTLREIVSDARTASRGDPILLLGEILRPPVSGNWTDRLLTDPVTMTIDITGARLLTVHGAMEDVGTRWIGVREVRSWGGLGRALGIGDDVALLCLPADPGDRKGLAATKLVDVALGL